MPGPRNSVLAHSVPPSQLGQMLGAATAPGLVPKQASDMDRHLQALDGLVKIYEGLTIDFQDRLIALQAHLSHPKAQEAASGAPCVPPSVGPLTDCTSALEHLAQRLANINAGMRELAG